MEAAEEKPTSPREKDEKTDALASGPTGVAGSDLERRAAARLVEELESKGRSARVQEMKIPASESATITLHAALTLAATLIGMKWPAIGAAICLIAAFSFYSERGLGLRLIGRAIPGRRTGNVLSPPPGPAWEEVEVILDKIKATDFMLRAVVKDEPVPGPLARILRFLKKGLEGERLG